MSSQGEMYDDADNSETGNSHSRGRQNQAFSGDKGMHDEDGLSGNSNPQGAQNQVFRGNTTDAHPDLKKVDLEWGPSESGTDPANARHKNRVMQKVTDAHDWIGNEYKENENIVKKIIWGVLFVGYIAYFIGAMMYAARHDIFYDEPNIRLLVVSIFIFVCVACYVFRKYLAIVFGGMGDCLKPRLKHRSKAISNFLVTALFVFCVIFIIVDVAAKNKEYYNFVSAAGIIIITFLMFLFSHNPGEVRWKVVIWGLTLQLTFAILILRWDFGYDAFQWIGDRVTTFLSYTAYGSQFVFGSPGDPFDWGNSMNHHFFAFRVLPTVIFFGTFISVMYHLGVIQFIIKYIATVMQWAMGTTAAESLNAAANIFIGQSEAPLMIKPLIQYMTRSELHSVMTGGFATIAGTVLAAYIEYGVPANHLICASIMSAPAALAMSKLFYPETEETKTSKEDVEEALVQAPATNLMEAASRGACDAVGMVANIAANLIAFVAMLAFVNSSLTWFGNRIGVEELTFEFICSYLLWPLAFIMGVKQADCRHVAELIGVKTFLNEFIAYERLGKFIDNRKLFDAHVELFGHNNTYSDEGGSLFLYKPHNVTVELEKGILADRSMVISTYALCGFANVGSIGIMLGALTKMAPHRQKDIASIVVRAMVAGNVACFLTACVAGLLYKEVTQ